MIIRRNNCREAGEVTIFELFYLIAAIVLGQWLARKFSSHFEGARHTVVFWSVAIISTLVFFLVFLYTVGYLLGFLVRRKSHKPSRENNKSDAA